jgi:hypothetical protein
MPQSRDLQCGLSAGRCCKPVAVESSLLPNLSFAPSPDDSHKNSNIINQLFNDDGVLEGGPRARDDPQLQCQLLRQYIATVMSVIESLLLAAGGLRAADDPQINASFSGVYHQHSLQVPWHLVLGCARVRKLQSPTREAR